ncbi:probable Ras GTPase-activating protein isoform X2 [Drosophila navojoa]|uniref:probable Ras GTPase-activating protein isoform X2 n=1 Tax=Drosophila navojoa TaxID=7232 RepID=UPI0011BF86AF|nr:probable Ras GTPase-activating protein isoform X2 [Drosophila navojoa]
MGRRTYLNRAYAISYPSRVEGWLDVCETEGELTRMIKPLPWGPLYCVLQQDDQTFTAYCSEEISLGDVCYEDIPRVRLDRARRPVKALWHGPPTLAEENEDSDSCLSTGMTGLNDIVLNTTLYNDLGDNSYVINICQSVDCICIHEILVSMYLFACKLLVRTLHKKKKNKNCSMSSSSSSSSSLSLLSSSSSSASFSPVEQSIYIWQLFPLPI